MKTPLLLTHRINTTHLLTLHLLFPPTQFHFLPHHSHITPIPLSFNNTPHTQSFPPYPPISSISQTTSSTTQPTPYNPYVSLYPAFQNFLTHSHQPPPNPPQPPLSTSTIPFNSSSLHPSPPFPTTPSVPFAALSDPIKLFDGLDHSYPPEKFLAHLSARGSPFNLDLNLLIFNHI